MMTVANAPSLAERAALMLAHCEANGVEISSYWRGYVENTLTEMALCSDDPFSPDTYFADAFGGGTFGVHTRADRFETLSQRLATLLSKPFSEKIPWAMRQSPLYRAILGPLFVSSVGLRKNAARNRFARGHYAPMVRCAFDCLKDDIAAFGLQPRKYRTADDVDVSASAYFSLQSLQRFKTLVHFQGHGDARGKTVIEIGSGLGELARLYLATGLARKYIIVDIAPALAFAEHHLTLEFGAATIDGFDPRRRSVDVNDGRLVTVLSPDQLPLVPTADMGINQFSFGEMSEAIIERYIGELRRMGVDHFFTINHRLTKPNNVHKIGTDSYMRWFQPEMTLRSAMSFSLERLLPSFTEDLPGTFGYQFLHFARR